MEDQNKNKKLHTDEEDIKKRSSSEPHWAEILEPYLKKFFEGEEEHRRPFHERLSETLQQIVERIWIVRRRFFMINAIMISLILAYAMFIMKPYFDATVVILPDYGSKSSTGNLGGLAAMAGISLGEGSSNMDVYRSLLTSEVVLEPVINTRYFSQEISDSVNLIEYFEIERDSKMDSIIQKRKMFLDVYKVMMSRASISIDNKTKILTITVRMPEPQLSAQVANNIVKSLDSYVRTKRKSNATMQRSYIETRVAQIRDSLNISENMLKIFTLRNRTISQSPDLILEQSRLNRQVQIYQTVFAELTRQLEIARIDEIRDTPIINVQEWAGVPVAKAGPKRIQTIVMAYIVFLFLIIIYILFYREMKMYIKSIIIAHRD